MGLRDFFRPRWQHPDGAVRAAAVKALTDQTLIARLVKTDDDWNVRRTAVTKLTDQALLAEVAETNEDPSVRWAAAQALLGGPLHAELGADDTLHLVARESGRRFPHTADSKVVPIGHQAEDTEVDGATAGTPTRSGESPLVDEYRRQLAEAKAQSDVVRREARAATEALSSALVRARAEADERVAGVLKDTRDKAAQALTAQLSRVQAEADARLEAELSHARAGAERRRTAEWLRLEAEAAEKCHVAARDARQSATVMAAATLAAEVERLQGEADRKLTDVQAQRDAARREARSRRRER